MDVSSDPVIEPQNHEPKAATVKGPSQAETLLQFQVKLLEVRVKDYEAKISDIREYVKKMESEIEQIRIRSQRDMQKNIDKSAADFFQSILHIVDNFERSLKTVEKHDAFSEGIRLIHGQLEETLERSGLSKIQSKGEDFNPAVHEAIASLPVQTNDEDGKIIEEVKAGYKFKDFVVRAAQVIVGNKLSPELHESKNN